MKARFTLTTLLAALTVLGLGITPALADSGQGTIPNTVFTELPGVVVAKPATGSTFLAKAQSDPSIGVYWICCACFATLAGEIDANQLPRPTYRYVHQLETAIPHLPISRTGQLVQCRMPHAAGLCGRTSQ